VVEQQVAFWYLSVVAVGLGGGVLILRNPVHAALALVGVIFHVAGLFVVLGNGFLAAVQVIVYAGGIVVLFLFTLMMLDLRALPTERTLHRQLWLALPLGVVLAIEAVFISAGAPAVNSDLRGAFNAAAVADFGGSTQALARVLFNEYLLPFEVASVLLLAAAIGAIVLARRLDEAPPRPARGARRAGSSTGLGDSTGPDAPADAPAKAPVS